MKDTLVTRPVIAALVAALAVGIRPAGTEAQSRQSQARPAPADSAPSLLFITGVTPDTALAGSFVEIALSREMATFGKDTLRPAPAVFFGPLEAEVTAVSLMGVRVQVPEGARRGGSYPIVVAALGVRTPEFPFVAGLTWWQEIFTGDNVGLAGFWLVVTITAWWLWTQRRSQKRQKVELESAKAQLEQLNKLRFQAEIDKRGAQPSAPAPVPNQRPSAGGAVTPAVPGELVEALVGEQAILFAGPGLSAQANFPTSYETLSALLEHSGADRDELARELQRGHLTEVAELLLQRLDRKAIIRSVAHLYQGESTATTPVHESLGKLPFVGAVSIAWDSMVERCFQSTRRAVPVLSPGAPESSGPPPTPNDFVVVKPFGSIARPETFLFTMDEAVRAVQRNRTVSRTLAAMLGSRSVLFLGTSLRSIQEFLAGTQFTLSDKAHFALVPAQEVGPLQRELFEGKYRIRLIPFDPSPGFPEVGLFARALGERVAHARRETTRPPLQKVVLSSVTLTNIGAFKTLAVAFNPQWNVILGNNGSGKSTLLRAIALGLCGDDVDASRSARKLLRTGTEEGTIVLQVGATKYTTVLRRDGDRVRVESQFTALQQGSWVVLGFPPLRGVSTRDPVGVGPAGKPSPVVEDLHPLIRGSIDERVNDLKQWLVNIDAGMRSNDPAERERNKRLHNSFWSLLRKLTPGVKIDPGEVRSGSWEVMVNTEDGPISIDQVSQGMSSIFGWLGAALQRMHEIHHAASDPEREPALVLVDEIDAHLHPEWQQRLVGLIREHFPSLQIIATSHSPLVVAGMKSQEVFVAARDDDDRTIVTILPVPSDVPFEMLRFDQILMSPLFGLTSTRSEASKKEYVKLAAKPAEERTPDERKRYEALRAALLDSTHPQSTAQGRQMAESVREAVSAVIREDADPEELRKKGKLTPELAAELRARLKAIAPEAEAPPPVQNAVSPEAAP